MTFFAKKKEKEYETEVDIPSFSIDPNGFVIFDDPELGGAAVLEVIPRASTESFTHEDPIFHNRRTDVPGYESSTGFSFYDNRRQIIESWVRFLNSLVPCNESDDAIHIQIIAKKCTSSKDHDTGDPYWTTRLQEAVYDTKKNGKKILDSERKKSGGNSVKRELLKRRMLNYIGMLNTLDDQSPREYGAPIRNILDIDVRSIPTYVTRFFLVVSYTPTSEGWWMDGRDSDYYVTDSVSVKSLFDEDKFVDTVTDFVTSRINKNKDENDNDGGDFFRLETDRTAQVIATRVNRILRFTRYWDREHERNDDNNGDTVHRMPFELKRMDAREVGALIRMFPDIMTPYWDKIWDLTSDQDDVLRNLDVDIAIASDDARILHDRALDRSIMDGTVRISNDEKAREAYLSRFEDLDLSSVSGVSDEYDDSTWSPEREEELSEKRAKALAQHDDVDSLWSDIDDSLSFDDIAFDDEARRKEYLSHYKNRGAAGSVMRSLDSGDE